ncbi:unnamed protein product, partial [Cuscuta europaea]
MKDQANVNIQLSKKKLASRAYTATIRILTSNGVAPSNETTLATLRSKHLFAPPPVFSSELHGVQLLITNSNMVFSRLCSFPKGTSCGRDGLHAQHMLDALTGPAVAIANEVLHSVTAIVNLLLLVGTIWKRLVSKVAASMINKEMASYLGKFQFGV